VPAALLHSLTPSKMSCSTVHLCCWRHCDACHAEQQPGRHKFSIMNCMFSTIHYGYRTARAWPLVVVHDYHGRPELPCHTYALRCAGMADHETCLPWCTRPNAADRATSYFRLAGAPRVKTKFTWLFTQILHSVLAVDNTS
jgi:hypothetical protein